MNISQTFTRSDSDRHSFGIAIEEPQVKMLSVKILAENIDMELPITLEEFYSQHTFTWLS